MSVRWITDALGTAPWPAADAGDAVRIDVRMLRDGPGNTLEALMPVLEKAQTALDSGQRAVLCCDHGISRSNAVAAAVLSRQRGCTYSQAVQTVVAATAETGLKVRLVADLARLLESPTSHTGQGRSYILGSDSLLGRALVQGLGPARLCGQDTGDLLLRNPALLHAELIAKEVGTVVMVWHPARLDTNQAAGELIAILRNVLEACAVAGCRLLFRSGFQVFSGGPHPGLCEFTEAATPCPAGADGDALYLAERLLEQYRERDGLRALVLRMPRIYGPGDTQPGLLNTLCRSALSGKPILTHAYENGVPAMDLLHVDDAAALVTACLDRGCEGVLHAAPSAGIAVPDLARLLVSLADSPSIVGHITVADVWRAVRLSASPDSLPRDWQPSVPLKDGLAELLHSMKDSNPPSASHTP